MRKLKLTTLGTNSLGNMVYTWQELNWLLCLSTFSVSIAISCY